MGLLVAIVLVLASCAAGPNDATAGGSSDLAGFWLGLWHGVISPVTFVISLFTSDVSIYEVHNNGNWYDFGFILGVAAAFSGAAGSGSAARRNRQSPSGKTSKK
ncbi:MAG: hypothetical protein GEV10_14350 [Streptosporangiales bacterium]|nr:hypothetical protein [Streptosporangiales bacterium]